MGVLPLTEKYRQHLVDRLYFFGGAQDPLAYLETKVFRRNSDHLKYIVPPAGRPIAAFYREVVRYCELSAWSEEPPLLVGLLQAFPDTQNYVTSIRSILKEGPFRCHPPGKPVLVSRVAAELPLIGRKPTRAAAKGFNLTNSMEDGTPKRVLRVWGGIRNGKTYTLRFFQYLAAIQPERAAVLHIDFGNPELVTLAAIDNVPIELLLARKLEAQARGIRADLHRREDPDELELDVPERVHVFAPLTDEQQRTRWTKQLARELVERVLYRYDEKPAWWVIVFDNCKGAPLEAQEFVRRLVELAAGTGPDDVSKALATPLRVVLLGDADALIPSPVYDPHVVEDDLTNQVFGPAEITNYFGLLARARQIKLDPVQIAALTLNVLAKASTLMGQAKPLVTFIEVLAEAVAEQALQLEAAKALEGGEG